MMGLKTVKLHEEGCFGVLMWEENPPFAVTVERTFAGLSTIITNGTYKCKRDFYHKGDYETFEIIVPGHNRVLFHKGNREIDSMACVCVAESFTRLDGYAAIGDSAHGFAEFMSVTKGLDEFDMIVTGRP